jgi:hypothetical protein
VVSPTPYGTCAELEGIVEVCHRRGKPLIVDEAWGAHLPFHDDLPTSAMDAGADVCVVSVHKMGHGFEQGSVFHRQGELVDWRHLAACADLLMTTVLVYSAIDGWRRQMVDDGARLLGAALALADNVRRRKRGDSRTGGDGRRAPRLGCSPVWTHCPAPPPKCPRRNLSGSPHRLSCDWRRCWRRGRRSWGRPAWCRPPRPPGGSPPSS